MNTMKAIRIHAYGETEELRYEDAPRPSPKPFEVLVRVHAAGVNPVDWKVRKGHLKEVLGHSLPLTLGWDVSGTVAELGPGAEGQGFALGDAVFGRPDLSRDGAYAEYIVVKTTELAHKPTTLDHVHAAAVPLAALTAWQALFEAEKPFTSANLQPGQTVLVHAGAGGVGTFAIQLAKWRGARVLATGSARNEKFLRELGADEVIDYASGPFEHGLRDVDVVFDTVGSETQTRSWGVLRAGGTLVSIVGAPSEALAKTHGAHAAYVFVQPNSSHLTEIARLIDAGTLAPVIAEVLPLADAARAHSLSEAGHVRGKLVLRVV
jgi:NADPH:quinone reductase-like Zn-dependent oxidoreductase